MLSSLFKTKPVIDKASEAWILDSFTWCLEQLDGSFFHRAQPIGKTY
jgi:hypothetical protein